MSAKNTPESFWARVSQPSPDECWEWQGAVTNGYGRLNWNKVPVMTHRLAYFLTKGNIELTIAFRMSGVAKKYKSFVLHICDNRKCCNPAHLFLGSMRDNVEDAYSKKRMVAPSAKLIPFQIKEIREKHKRGSHTQIQLAKAYGLTSGSMSRIITNKTYRDV